MLTRRFLLSAALAAPALSLISRPAFASSTEVFNVDGLAIRGTDPVAYFTQGTPVPGEEAFQLDWMAATWRFANMENMVAFEANPRDFAPQYGGYCAYAMSKGAVASSVPEAWTIYEDKLYLNFSTGVRDIWQQDIPGNIALADGFWPDALT